MVKESLPVVIEMVVSSAQAAPATLWFNLAGKWSPAMYVDDLLWMGGAHAESQMMRHGQVFCRLSLHDDGRKNEGFG